MGRTVRVILSLAARARSSGTIRVKRVKRIYHVGATAAQLGFWLPSCATPSMTLPLNFVLTRAVGASAAAKKTLNHILVRADLLLVDVRKIRAEVGGVELVGDKLILEIA